MTEPADYDGVNKDELAVYRPSTGQFVVYEAVQLHGGTGYMRDSEVERHYRDARILGIGGGATEVMNDLIAKALGW